MTDDALTMRGPVHGTKGAREAAIDSSVGAVTEIYDFIWFGTAAALYFGHALVPGASPIACTLASFATLGVWVNLDTFVNNAAIITINDLEHQRHGFSGLPATPVGGPSPNWRPDCQSPPYPAPRCWPAGTRRPATLTGKGGRRRSTDPHQHSPGPNVVNPGDSQTSRCRDEDPLAASGSPTRTAAHRYGGDRRAPQQRLRLPSRVNI